MRPKSVNVIVRTVNRRHFVKTASLAGLASLGARVVPAAEAPLSKRKFTLGLACGLIGLPALLAGSWLGLRLYGKLDEAAFRKVVLALLLMSGLALVAPLGVR